MPPRPSEQGGDLETRDWRGDKGPQPAEALDGGCQRHCWTIRPDGLL